MTPDFLQETNGLTRHFATGWQLSGTVDSQGTSTNVEFSVTANSVLTWQWDTEHWLSVSAREGGSCTGADSGWYAAGAELDVTAVPDRYYEFDAWSGDRDSVNNPIQVEMSEPLALTANFALAYTESGVPQWWLGQYGMTNNFEAAATEDTDGDGSKTWQEYVAGTDPTNANSVLKLLLDLQPGANELRWDAAADRSYTVYFGSNLLEGVTNVLVEYYSLFPMSLILPDTLHADDPTMFYRIEVELKDQ